MTHVRGHGRSSTPKKGTGAGGPGGRYSGGAKPGTGAGGPGGRYGRADGGLVSINHITRRL